MNTFSVCPIQSFYHSSGQSSEELEHITLRLQHISLNDVITRLAMPLLCFDFMSGYNYPVELYQKKSVVLYRGSAETILQHAVRHARMRQYRQIMPKKLVALMEESLIRIERSNRLHGPHTSAAVILQAAYDPDEVMASTMWLAQLECIAKTHYISIQIMGEHEQLGSSIRDVKHELSSRVIKALIIRAHGDTNLLAFSSTNLYRTMQARAEDFICLEQQATIYFNSCLTGLGLAERIASIQPRPVYAATERVATSFYTNCCCHGLEMIAFTSEYKQIVKKFQQHENAVIATVPCTATDETINTIYRTILQQIHDSAESGDTLAQNRAGIVYERGYLHTQQSYYKAAKWYRKAAEQGDSVAQCNLAKVFWFGLGVAQSYLLALQWLRRAAEQGNEDAQYYLGRAYWHGQGVPQSDAIAVQWFGRAASQGHAQAVQALREITTAVSPPVVPVASQSSNTDAWPLCQLISGLINRLGTSLFRCIRT